MKFLKSWTIDLTKVPVYTIFKKPFVEDVDIHLAKLILNTDDERITQEMKDEFNKLVQVIDKKTNTINTLYSERFKMGRRYPECPEEYLKNGNRNPYYKKMYGALIRHPRIIKNTIFKYHDYIDIDQRKGHPTIIYDMAKKNGITLTAYEDYLNNFDKHVKKMIKYYSVEGEEQLTKKDIKQLFNRTIYGGGHEQWIKDITQGTRHHGDDTTYKTEPRPMKNTNKPYPFYKQFYEETQEIINIVYTSNREITNQTCDGLNEEWKKKSRTMSYFCGIIENEITFQAYKFLHTSQYITNKKVDWGLDGLTFPRNELTTDEIEEMVELLNKAVRKNTGFNLVEFVVKDFDDSEILHELIEERNEMLINDDNTNDEEEDEEDNNPRSFYNVAKHFEQNHCKIINNSVFVKKTAEGNNIMFSKSQIMTSYENLTFEGVGKNDKVETKNFIKAWTTNNEHQRQYQAMGIYPDSTLCPSNVYNLWTPFEVKKIKKYKHHQEGLDYILNHIKILCGNEQHVHEYMCKWIGQMFKYPEVKTICPTLISDEGSGKGSLVQFLKNMMGQQKIFETATPDRDVWGSFNGRMADSYLVILNELSKKQTLQAEGVIKALITDPTLTVNNKGVNQIEITSYHRFLITTNKQDPITTKKGDRRYLIIRSSDERKGNIEYFRKFREFAGNDDVLRTCYEYFTNLPDLDKFGLLPRPLTEYQEDMQEANQDPVLKWFEEYVAENKNKKVINILSTDLLQMFECWKVVNHTTYEINNTSFGIRIKRFKFKGVDKKRSSKGTVIVLDIPELVKELKINELVSINTKTIVEYNC
jgi:uncharacterized protein YihD (DUF1040 family)